jgi:hypothetical protein
MTGVFCMRVSRPDPYHKMGGEKKVHMIQTAVGGEQFPKMGVVRPNPSYRPSGSARRGQPNYSGSRAEFLCERPTQRNNQIRNLIIILG